MAMAAVLLAFAASLGGTPAAAQSTGRMEAANPGVPAGQTNFQIENRTLTEFLEWEARRTGRRLVFVSPAARITAGRIVLHGSISRVEPTRVLLVVMATTRLGLTETKQAIVVSAEPR